MLQWSVFARPPALGLRPYSGLPQASAVSFEGGCMRHGKGEQPDGRVMRVSDIIGEVSEMRQSVVSCLLSAVSLVFALLVAYETVVERTFRRRIRSDETATWSNRGAAE